MYPERETNPCVCGVEKIQALQKSTCVTRGVSAYARTEDYNTSRHQAYRVQSQKNRVGQEEANVETERLCARHACKIT